MRDITEITRDLAAVDGKLRSLPDDAFAEKHELLKLRDALREEAASFAEEADTRRSTPELLAELSGLRSRLAELEGQKIDLVTQAGGGASGTSNMGNLGGVSLNAQMLDASGASRIQARIGRIKGLLDDRGVDVPPAP